MQVGDLVRRIPEYEERLGHSPVGIVVETPAPSRFGNHDQFVRVLWFGSRQDLPTLTMWHHGTNLKVISSKAKVN